MRENENEIVKRNEWVSEGEKETELKRWTEGLREVIIR